MAVHNWEFFKLQEGDLGGYFFLIAVNHWHAFGDKNGPYLFTTIEEAEGFLRSHSVDGVLYEDSYNHQYKIDWDLNKAEVGYDTWRHAGEIDEDMRANDTTVKQLTYINNDLGVG